MKYLGCYSESLVQLAERWKESCSLETLIDFQSWLSFEKWLKGLLPDDEFGGISNAAWFRIKFLITNTLEIAENVKKEAKKKTLNVTENCCIWIWFESKCLVKDHQRGKVELTKKTAKPELQCPRLAREWKRGGLISV